MDTRRLEQIGETLVTCSLLEAGILPTKPFFDHLGADLIGFTSVDDRGRFCRIQCKYRTLNKRTSISIDASHVVGAFVLFVCIRVDKQKRLYCLLPEEIRLVFTCRSANSKMIYRLTIAHKNISALDPYDYFRLSQERNAAILHLMKVSSPTVEFATAISGLHAKMTRISELRRKHNDLKDLLHQFQLADLEKKAADEKIAILEEYAGFMEEQIREQERQSNERV